MPSIVPQVVIREGFPFPSWTDPFHLEAVRCTKALRDVDGALLVTHVLIAPPEFQLPAYCFVTWVRSLQYRGYIPDRVLRQPDGEPLRGRLPVEDLLRQFRAFYRDAERGITQPQRIQEHNDRVRAGHVAAERSKNQEMFRYAERAMKAELEGASRFSPQDVVDGYDAANESAKPAPVGRVTSLPSETPKLILPPGARSN